MNNTNNTVYVGIDWAHSQHQVVVCDRDGHTLLCQRFEARCPGAQAELIEQLAAIGADYGQLCIGIETAALPLVDTLLEQGWPLYLVPPSKVDKMRQLTSATGAKDDLRDARAIAAVLASAVTRGWLQPIEAGDAHYGLLRTLSRERSRLVTQRTAAQNRLRDALSRYWPAFLACGLNLGCDWVLKLFKHLRSPQRTRRCQVGPVQRLLDTKRGRRRDGAELLAALSNNIDASPERTLCAQIEAESAVEELVWLAGRIKPLQRRIHAALEALSTHQRQAQPERNHSDVEILMSLPGMGAMLAAVILGEAGHFIAARDLESLRRTGGVAPVTSQSGRRDNRRASMRYQRNKHLANGLQCYAGLAANNNALDAERRRRMRAAGHRAGRIRRQMADGLLKVTVAMLKADELYDDTRRVGARRALTESLNKSNP